MMARATEIIKAIPNVLETPIVFLNFQRDIPDFELFIKGLVEKIIKCNILSWPVMLNFYLIE
jgi:hypothetical protein